MDNATKALQVSEANVRQQQEGLAKLLGGTVDTGDSNTLALPAIDDQRQTIADQANDVEALVQQKKQLEVALKELQVSKDRLVLCAPEDGKVLQILSKKGEMISPNTPVILLESKRYYYDIYINETQAVNLYEGKTVTGHTIAGDKKVTGKIRLLTQAPGFADLKMTREKGQADLSAFQVRVYTAPGQEVLPGMTIEVNDDEFLKR